MHPPTEYPSVPLDATARDYLQLSLTNAPAQITSSGLDNQVKSAETQFQRKIDRAFPFFSAYGLTREELDHAACRAAILKPHEEPCEPEP